MLQNKKEVIKPSAAIQVENRIGLLERCAWNWLLAHAYDELPTAETHRINVSDLMGALGYSSRNHAHLRETLKGLTGSVLEWNVIHKDKEIWGATTLLAEVEIKDGVCTYAFGPTLRKRLYNPRMYARISLSLQNQFQSKHALALYECCVDFLNDETGFGQSAFIPIPEFRKLMGIPEGMYPEFKKLNKWVIKDPLAEINRVTDLKVTAEYKKEGRTVVAVKFRVRRLLQLPGQSSSQADLFEDQEALPEIVHELVAAGLSKEDALDIWQQGVQYVKASPKPEPEAFDTYLREKIHLLKRRQASGKVENATGFLLEAIKKNFANPEFAAAQQKQEAKTQARKRHAQARERNALEEARARLTLTQDRAVHAYCQAMVTATPSLLDEAFAALQHDSAFHKHCQPGKTPAEHYAERPVLWIAVDQFLEQRYPERFRALHAAQQAELAALDAKLAALA